MAIGRSGIFAVAFAVAGSAFPCAVDHGNGPVATKLAAA